jgi:hypothetical protein
LFEVTGEVTTPDRKAEGPLPGPKRRMSTECKQGAVPALLKGEDVELVSRELA